MTFRPDIGRTWDGGEERSVCAGPVVQPNPKDKSSHATVL